MISRGPGSPGEPGGPPSGGSGGLPPPGGPHLGRCLLQLGDPLSSRSPSGDPPAPLQGASDLLLTGGWPLPGSPSPGRESQIPAVHGGCPTFMSP